MVAAVASGESGLDSWGDFLKKEYRRPIFFCALIAIAPIAYGYDGTYFTSLLETPVFVRQFGDIIDGKPAISSSDQSLWVSIIQVGEVVGSLAAGPIGDYSGRKGGLLSAIILLAIGVVLQMIIVGSGALLTVGRLIAGAGIGIISNAAPLYLSEIPPVEIRGACVSSWQLMLAIGQVIGACVGLGAHTLESTASWRIPVGINLVWVVLLFGVLFIVPESPRWLLYRGKEAKAERALKKIHAGSDYQDSLVQEQLAILNKSREEEAESSSSVSRWSDLWRNPVERRKFIATVGILVSQQISGVQFIFSYTTTFFTLVGLKDTFIITIIVDCIEVVGVIASFFVVNRFGRRPLLLYTGIFMLFTLLVVGALGAVAGQGERFEPYLADHPSFGKAVAAMICLYVFAFNVAWGPLAWVVAAEMSTGRNRQKHLSIGTALFWVSAWAVTFTLPYLFQPNEAGLGPMIGFVYSLGALASLLFVYFFIPETIGRTLEEINFMMEARIPTRKWKDFDLATVVAKDEKKGTRGTTEHVETATGAGAGPRPEKPRTRRFETSFLNNKKANEEIDAVAESP
ncbi:sugar transporter [Kwoniella mangroviensis CBS 10435]|uniref:Sugar transporter n=1 Tax=Kwoniella mangroviensis CBS 10435 TaxID=1331196 RepID=A0A1B9IMG2_9TREE|nr:sugar transporter [Kwoniella mangroviensis CBS 10435]OCF75324.1 sugar transporter [Kwoniella mangroviensis CBS 8886]